MSTPGLEPHVIALLRAEHGDPFSILGPHPSALADGRPATAIRGLFPGARAAWVVFTHAERTEAMEVVHPLGFFEAVIDTDGRPFGYRMRVEEANGYTHEFYDPYSFGVLLGDLDLHLMREGTHLDIPNHLGAHVREIGGVRGVGFAVWAPNAQRVSVVGPFNGWDGRRHPMRRRGDTGLWELFVPGVPDGVAYKFEIRSALGALPFSKADPVAFRSEVPPDTASVVCDLDGYSWGDAAWMEDRSKRDVLSSPMSIYEVHLGSWRRIPDDGNRSLSYLEHATALVDYVKSMGYTHIEVMPVLEHPFGGSWGYEVTGYYAVSSRWGTPQEFMALVDACHQRGIGVLLDWVPAHFPNDAHALARFDGTSLYEHADPRQGTHPDWDTLIFNYGRTEVFNFLLASAVFWLKTYHLDGLRIDAVASMLYLDYSRQRGQWVPNRYGGKENLEAIRFLKAFNAAVHRECPGAMTIAEESTSWPMVSRPVSMGGLGFTLKWNMGWMHDVLHYFEQDPVYRKFHSRDITFSMLYAYSENFVLAISHDEVVHGKGSLFAKMPGDEWQRLANLRVLYGYMYAHPGKKSLFMGSEIGQRREWNHDGSLDWHLLAHPGHDGLRTFVRDLNRLYVSEPALHEMDFSPGGFQWIDCEDHWRSVYSLIRRAKDPEDFVVVVCNFTPVPRFHYRLGVPSPGRYRELLNSDSELYWGSNLGNYGGVTAEEVPSNGHAYSLSLTVPPLGVVVLKRAKGE